MVAIRYNPEFALRCECTSMYIVQVVHKHSIQVMLSAMPGHAFKEKQSCSCNVIRALRIPSTESKSVIFSGRLYSGPFENKSKELYISTW